MSINPSRRKFTEGMDQRRASMLRYFTIFIIILVPLYFGYQGFKNIKPDKTEVQKIDIETGDRPIEKEIKIVVKADGGLNFRKEAKKDAEKIGKIPDGTKLTVRKEIDGWYEIEFEGKQGWIAKGFTVTQDQSNADLNKEEKLKDWQSLKNYGFSLKYPPTWSGQDYGKQADGDFIVGLSFSQLPAKIQPGFFMPIDIRVSEKSRGLLEQPVKSLNKKTVSEIAISGTKGIKYLYTDNVDSTEKTKIFFSVGSKTIIISENGGYGAELEDILKTFSLG